MLLIDWSLYAVATPFVHLAIAAWGPRRTLMAGTGIQALAYMTVGPAPFFLPAGLVRQDSSCHLQPWGLDQEQVPITRPCGVNAMEAHHLVQMHALC